MANRGKWKEVYMGFLVILEAIWADRLGEFLTRPSGSVCDPLEGGGLLPPER